MKNPIKGFLTSSVGFQVVALLAVGVLLTTTVLYNSFTKYTSTKSGQDTAHAVSFAYDIYQSEESLQFLTDTPAKIDLFGTTIDDVGIAGENDTDSNGNKLIGPGTEGYFRLNFRNRGTVSAQVVFDTLGYVNEGGLPIIYFFNGNYYSDLYGKTIEGNSSTAYKYFRHRLDSAGIVLNGNMDNFFNSLNSYYTMDNTNATAFLDVQDKIGATNYIDVNWFWPYEARLIDVDLNTAGDQMETSSKAYKFDAYDGSLGAGQRMISMAPAIRVTQIDEFKAMVKTDAGNQVWSNSIAEYISSQAS